jgi:hypothetical protein
VAHTKKIISFFFEDFKMEKSVVDSFQGGRLERIFFT